jgi:uncharacterized protein YjaG (DUF416 family)
MHLTWEYCSVYGDTVSYMEILHLIWEFYALCGNKVSFMGILKLMLEYCLFYRDNILDNIPYVGILNITY